MKLWLLQPLGAKMDVYLSTARHERIVAHVDARTGLSVGATLSVAIDMDRVHFFEPGEAGRTLASHDVPPAWESGGHMARFLGLDASTQSLSGLIIDMDTGTVSANHSVVFGERLPHFHSPKGFLLHEDPPGQAQRSPDVGRSA